VSRTDHAPKQLRDVALGEDFPEARESIAMSDLHAPSVTPLPL
jgi:hypothetical protein